MAGDKTIGVGISPGAVAQDFFGGAVYENQKTSANGAVAFETGSKKLRDAIISVATNTVSFGDATNQRRTIAAAASIQLSKIDLSTLYFKSTVTDTHGVVTIIGTKE